MSHHPISDSPMAAAAAAGGPAVPALATFSASDEYELRRIEEAAPIQVCASIYTHAITRAITYIHTRTLPHTYTTIKHTHTRTYTHTQLLVLNTHMHIRHTYTYPNHITLPFSTPPPLPPGSAVVSTVGCV